MTLRPLKRLFDRVFRPQLVYHVTNLCECGCHGSLKWAMESADQRKGTKIVFDVTGMIGEGFGVFAGKSRIEYN